MDAQPVAKVESLFRCGLPTENLKGWFAKHARDSLRIATYGVSHRDRLAHYVPRHGKLELLVGDSGIDPRRILDLHGAPEGERWQRLLDRLDAEEQNYMLRILRRLAGWQRAGAIARVALPAQLRGLMHLKLYLGDDAALIGSANFTLQGIEACDQHELLLEIAGPLLGQLRDWWSVAWAAAWPFLESSELQGPTAPQGNEVVGLDQKENIMSRGAQILLGHWLGEWGAWALNGNGVVAYPHQLQAVEWIRPDGKAYLLGDEVGLGKTFAAALLWMRHRQLYGEKARLIYITKPSLIIDAVSAFVSVLGVDEFLQTEVPLPQKAGDVHPRFSIFHAGTACWEMVADEDGRKRNKDHQVASLLKEGRYRMRPDAFREKIQWLRAIAARKLHCPASVESGRSLRSG